ncbi:BsuBI/PstI family type II restriction endonuclease [Aeromonas salmonicida]|uniref:BsuBI/PstI family type II restriction endonuclease n=1 Tax=Aeromonas salmonicida TaxID=645 RepID=UPI0038B7976A
MVRRPLSNQPNKSLILITLKIKCFKCTPRNTPNLVAIARYVKTQKTTISPITILHTRVFPAQNFGSQIGNELARLFARSTAGLIYVTAFPNCPAIMGRYLGEIAWETEVWVADAPSHLLHFNGYVS